MKRNATVLLFRPEVTKDEAAKALKAIEHLIELPEHSYDEVKTDDTFEVETSDGRKVTKHIWKSVERPFEMIDAVREFDDTYGFPVFYIP